MLKEGVIEELQENGTAKKYSVKYDYLKNRANDIYQKD
jgi:hypothetical protein